MTSPGVYFPHASLSDDVNRALLQARNHRVWGFTGEEVACACDRKWRSRDDYSDHIALVALTTYATARYEKEN